VATSTRLRSAVVFLVDGTAGDNGNLDSFSGVLGWAVYQNNAGVPGSLVAKGQGANVTQVDTLLQSSGGDLARVHFDLDNPVSLAPGTYWFALREGTWGSGGDGSEVRWAATPAIVGYSTADSTDVANAASWTANVGAQDDAFALYGDAVVWDQAGIFQGAGSANVSNFVIANDFQLAAAARFSALEAWLDDQDEAGPFGRFSGALSWGLYDDAAGLPGTLLDSGAGSGIRVSDTGLTGANSEAIAHLELTFGKTIALDAGTYWLALHEGSWGSDADGSIVAWVIAGSVAGSGTKYSVNLNPPGPWASLGGSDTGFVLSDQILFASGFEPGTACAWSEPGGVCP